MRIGGISSALCPPELVLFHFKPLQVEELSGIAEQEKSASIGTLAPGHPTVRITSAASGALLPFPAVVTSAEALHNMESQHSDQFSVQQPSQNQPAMLESEEQPDYLIMVVLVTIAVALVIALAVASVCIEPLSSRAGAWPEQKVSAAHVALAEVERRAREEAEQQAAAVEYAAWAEGERRAREEAWATEKRQAREAEVDAAPEGTTSPLADVGSQRPLHAEQPPGSRWPSPRLI
eukprot:gnl/TRDRNA2_/TRDRNA2_147596_c0_seq1.p1 gnl/TRDRNA2_/TRDRNA2_147596_c0~~gnl/TRDRNA2_/TRDRNA2_147596_c0_seq1.p1  ORF type:complete len:235 (-),score=41.25 gnl/TRDRNA2_/TRDRNA2_147596_c0_seq1:34-738(-)